jgi:hypothetical protein
VNPLTRRASLRFAYPDLGLFGDARFERGPSRWQLRELRLE